MNAARLLLLASMLISACDSSGSGNSAPEICTRHCARGTAIGCEGFIEEDCVRGCSSLVDHPCWDVIEAEALCDEQQPLSAYECTDGVPNLHEGLCTAESDAVRSCTASHSGGTADAMAPLSDASDVTCDAAIDADAQCVAAQP